GLLLGVWVAFGAIAELVDRGRFGRIALSESLRRLRGLPRTEWSTAIAHFGLGLTVIGIVTATAWQGELVTTLSAGQSGQLSGYTVTLDRLEDGVTGPNYTASRADFTITDPSGGTRPLSGERRVYAASGGPTTEA